MKYRFEIFAAIGIFGTFLLIYYITPQAEENLIAQKVIVIPQSPAHSGDDSGHYTQSRFHNRPIMNSYTSHQLSNADIAWHATQSYGWNCRNVTSKLSPIANEDFLVQCSSGLKLRVYLRAGKHPKITNMHGT